MIGREVQRLEIVIVSFDDRAFFNRVAEIAKDGDDFVHRLDDRMLRAERTPIAGEGDINSGGPDKNGINDRCACQLAGFHSRAKEASYILIVRGEGAAKLQRCFGFPHPFRDSCLQFVDANSGFSL